jgi:hypothetical protein
LRNQRKSHHGFGKSEWPVLFVERDAAQPNLQQKHYPDPHSALLTLHAIAAIEKNGQFLFRESFGTGSDR